jgi:DtxR family Mn-dependent transcriptional regulator
MKELWKKFDEVELTHSSVHHLLAMQALLKKNGYVRGVDISNYLNISRSSASITLRKLVVKGYIREDENKFYHFAGPGTDLVNSVLSKRRIIQLFFEKVLFLTPPLAEAEACKIEHLLDEETGKKLISFMGFFLSDAAEAKAFIEKYKSYHLDCSSTEDCEICEVKCYFSGLKSHENHHMEVKV